MPIYEYRCQACGDKFEKLVRRSEDAANADCPSCGDKHVQQEYSTFAARAGSTRGAAGTGGCPAGMCGNPGMCERN